MKFNLINPLMYSIYYYKHYKVSPYSMLKLFEYLFHLINKLI